MKACAQEATRTCAQMNGWLRLLLSYGFRGDGLEPDLGGSANLLDAPALDFEPAFFFGFFGSRFDLCCPLAMVAPSVSDPLHL